MKKEALVTVLEGVVRRASSVINTLQDYGDNDELRDAENETITLRAEVRAVLAFMESGL